MPVLESVNLSKTYIVKQGLFHPAKNKQALSNITFTLDHGKTLGIIGESGSGKTTLARQLVGSETPSSGKIVVDNTDEINATQSLNRKAHKKIRLIFQQANHSINPKIRLRTLLDDTLRMNTNLDSYQRNKKIREVLQLVGLRKDVADNFPHMFSMGEIQRIAIARALILEPKVIVADEPLAHLDMSIQAQVINLLLDLQEQLNLGYVFIANDLGVIKHVSDDVLVMCAGQTMEYGPADSIFSTPRNPYTRSLFASNPSVVDDRSTLLHGNREQRKHYGSDGQGCPFSSGCPFADQKCKSQTPHPTAYNDVLVACHHVNKLYC